MTVLLFPQKKTNAQRKIKFSEVISKVIQKMAFDAIRKELQRVVCTCYLACPAVALCGGRKVTAACPAVALCEGGKTLPLSDRRRGRFDNFEEF